MEVMFHQLCHILLVRSKSQALPTLQGMELHKDLNAGSQGPLGVSLDSKA